jgi:hypothetical protein
LQTTKKSRSAWPKYLKTFELLTRLHTSRSLSRVLLSKSLKKGKEVHHTRLLTAKEIIMVVRDRKVGQAKVASAEVVLATDKIVD